MLDQGLIDTMLMPWPWLASIDRTYREMRILFPICLDSTEVRYMPSVPKVPGSNPMPAGSYYI